jgi:acyl-CoA oxidase
VKGIELEAKWDPKTKEFILHSPTLTSSKWWNGALGKIATHSIIVAQLLLPKPSVPTEYVNHGPHQFIVQVRDLKTNKPLEGIAVGDIGAKYGYPGMDNAYCLFNHFRIPYSSFLCRYSKVDYDTGAYTKPENPVVVYGSLTYVRAQIVMHARLVLARAVTVAVRYLSIRRQFHDRDGDSKGLEVAVLDYPTVQIRILPLLATTFALHYSGKAMGELYNATRQSIAGGDFSALADMHSTSSGLKSLCTMLAADGIETSRRALGGQGFGGGSGLIQLNNDYLSKPTVEGDNWMITQQTAAYIIKRVEAVMKTPEADFKDGTSINLKEFNRLRRYADKGNKFDVLGNDLAIVYAFRRRAADLSFKAYEERVVKQKSWNTLLVQLHKLSKAHTQSFLVEKFHAALTSDNTIPPLAKPVLLDCFRLFAIYTMDAEGREFFNAGAVSNEQLDQLPTRIEQLMLAIRPHAVNLVDSWSIPDYLLDSALGRYNGKVYEDLFNRAHRLNPLNKLTFNPYYWDEEIVRGNKDDGTMLAKL